MIKYLPNIEGQKEKIYSKDPREMAGPDILEHKKQSRSLERKKIEKIELDTGDLKNNIRQ